MNFYSHHIGDYLSATAHLSLLEHGVYRRLIDVYYIHEAPLPVELKQIYRLVGAKSKDEREAVETVLEEFFTKTGSGWAQSRCDYEIEKCASGQQGRDERAANEAARVKRHREERAELFARLRETGTHAPWNIGIEALRELVARTSTTPLPATAPVTPATASPSPHYPITPLPGVSISEQTTTTTEHSSTENPQDPSSLSSSDLQRCKTLAERLTKLEAGRGLDFKIRDSNPNLRAWVAAGITDPQLREAYDLALEQRRRDQDAGAINPKFLHIFVQKVMSDEAGPPPVITAKAWHESASGIEAKGAELGIAPPDPQTGGFPAFKARVFKAAGMIAEAA